MIDQDRNGRGYIRMVTTAEDDDEVISAETYARRKVARHFITVRHSCY